jgi:prepilin peptidase CpaA
MKGESIMATVEIIVLFLIVLYAVFIDIRERRIPNKLILVGLICGITSACFQIGYINIFDRVGALCIGMAILFIPFALGGIGAGDVKLLGVIGLFVGIKGVVNVSLISFIVGGGIALCAIALHRLKKYKDVRSVCMSFINSIMTRKLVFNEEGKIALPFSVPLAIGTFLVLLFNWSIFA